MRYFVKFYLDDNTQAFFSIKAKADRYHTHAINKAGKLARYFNLFGKHTVEAWRVSGMERLHDYGDLPEAIRELPAMTYAPKHGAHGNMIVKRRADARYYVEKFQHREGYTNA